MKKATVSKNGGGSGKVGNLRLEECLDCVCYEFRKTARSVINFYDDALKASELKSNQFLILVAVAYLKSTNFKTLAEFLGIDQSTLARNLVTVEKQNLVKVRHGQNRREKMITLTAKGEEKLVETFPLWRKAQGSLVGRIGAPRWKRIRSGLAQVVSVTKGS